jgi:hypothetical protein
MKDGVLRVLWYVFVGGFASFEAVLERVKLASRVEIFGSLG